MSSDHKLIARLWKLNWTQEEIANAIVKAGYENEYSQKAVGKRLELFLKLKKVLNLSANL
jgi:hypothetical protein